MIKFHCERIKENVNRKDCEDCDQFEDCKTDGYLSEIDIKLGINSTFPPEKKRLEAFRKMLQRALKPGYVKDSKKNAYMWKILGGTDLQRAEFTEQNFQTICEVLGKACNSDLRDRLISAADGYLSTKAIWNGKPRYLKTKTILEKVSKLSTELSDCLDELDPDIHIILKKRCSYIDAFPRLQYEAKEIVENLLFKDRDLSNFPLILFFRELKNIFEDVTGQKATVTYKPEISKSNDSSKLSPFFQFVLTCIQYVDPEAY